ncbi:MAG: glycosyltransferase [Candidatus Gracilibacteria bacterium]|nr:glycosyltransferase [Candidatus Gracilibacteria bacterium]
MINNIPKTIHYCRFGRGKKSDDMIKCINSWKKYCPDYEIIEWNEDNFDVNSLYYTKTFYKKRKWAFVADYVRMYALYNTGGVYFDTDIEVLKNIDSLLENDAFTGYQDIFSIGGSIIGAKKGNTILKEILDFYKTKKTRIILPNLMNKIFKKYSSIKYTGKNIKIKDFTIYTKDYFYPFAYFEKSEDMIITENTYTIHHYDATWLPKIITKIFFPIIGFVAKKIKK